MQIIMVDANPQEAPWRIKAHRIIADECRREYNRVNRKADGTLYRRHRPYSVTVTAAELIDCLNKNDERRAKALFVRALS